MRHLSLLLLLLVPVLLSAQQKNIAYRIDSLLQAHNAAGISVVVVKNGKIDYSQAFGMRDVASNEALEENDLFRIASISKSFTATALMQLVEKKKVSLDDDFGQLIGFPVRNPNFPETVITLRMVLSHTSSINDSRGYFNFDGINPAKSDRWKEAYNAYEPGKGYQYCNLNFNMAGAVIERLTNTRFDQHIEKVILKPLGLRAGYRIGGLDSTKFATLYEFDSGKLIPSPMAYAPRTTEIENYVLASSTPIFSPTGGMKISAPDLARYMIMHMNQGRYKKKKIISPKSALIMQTPVTGGNGSYGLALHRSNTLIPGETMIGHTGSAYGLASAMFFNPEKKFGFVVICSGGRARERDGFNEILLYTIRLLYEHSL